MKEDREVRKQLSGPEAAPYMNLARKLLGQMKNQMNLGGLKQLKWSKKLENGVIVAVESIFGLDKVTVSVPVLPLKPEPKEVIKVNTIVDYVIYHINLRRFELGGAGEEIYSAISPQALSVARYADAYAVSYKTGGHSIFIDGEETAIDFGGNSSSIKVSGHAEFVAAAIADTYQLRVWSDDGVVVTEPIGVDVFAVHGISDDGRFILVQLSAGLGLYDRQQVSYQIVDADYLPSYASPVLSADGAVVAYSKNGSHPYFGTVPQSFRWTETGGSERIAETGVAYGSTPLGISDDGTYIVGQAYSVVTVDEFANTQAYKWTEDTGMELLALTPVPNVYDDPLNAATDVSDDGSVVIGSGQITGGTGMESFLMQWDDSGFVLLETGSPITPNVPSIDPTLVHIITETKTKRTE